MHSPIVTGTAFTTDRSSRNGVKPSMVILHHGATISLRQIIDLMQPGGRQVSAHCAVKDGQVVATVPEEFRAWSLSDQVWDARALTVETANESTTGWTVSAESHESLALLVADWAVRYGFPIIRSGDPKKWTVLGHREVYTIHGGSYATACPGGMNLDYIAQRAQELGGLMTNIFPFTNTGEKSNPRWHWLTAAGWQHTNDVEDARLVRTVIGDRDSVDVTPAQQARLEVLLPQPAVAGESGNGGTIDPAVIEAAAKAGAEAALAEIEFPAPPTYVPKVAS